MTADTNRPEGAPKTWRELEAEGVKRCCAMFVNGGRCRRRAVADDGDGYISWCTKHGRVMAGVRKENEAAIEAEQQSGRRVCGDDE